MRISLCIVARNEASFIAAAIASARSVVDEVVVVDTGSTDDTPAVARGAGAHVVHEPWPGDLARAHDLPVAHARGDWILGLDADEVLDPTGARLVAELARSGPHDGYRLPVRNYTYRWQDAKWRPADPLDPIARGADGYVPTHPVRLFRRDPAHTYTGAVHQTVAPAIKAAGGSIGHADVPIHHYGFLRFDRDKSALYLKLARRQVAATPNDPRAWADLGVLLLERERLPAAADAFRRARALGDRGEASFLLGRTLQSMGHPDIAVNLLEEAVRGNPGDASPRYDRADAWDALGLAAEDLGRPGEAERAYRAALRSRPAHPPATLNLAGLLADLLRLDEAEDVLLPWLAGHRGVDTAWSTLGTVRLRRGDLEGARRAFETALDIRPENLAARLNLGVTHRRAGRRHQARQAFAAAGDGLGTVEAALLGLEERLPGVRHRRRPRLNPTSGSPVLSLVSALAGGGGRVLLDTVTALPDRAHLVACADAFDFSGQGLRADLEAAGAQVVPVTSDGVLIALIRRIRPSVVIHHWWRGTLFPGAVRVKDEAWICIGHAPLPMPPGYDAYVVNSAFNHRFQVHLPADRLHRIPNGVDRERFETGARPPDGPVTIAALSRLDAGKFPRRLLAYLPPLAGARVLVAGFGARRHEIEPEIGRRPVRFVGAVRSGEVPRFLAGADIGLHLTETHEELCSMTVLEMLAAGLPVVAQPRGGLPEMLTHGVNGLLGADADEIAAHLRRLIDDADLRQRLGTASRQVARRFDIGRFRSSIVRLVEQLERRWPVTRRGSLFETGPASRAPAAEAAPSVHPVQAMPAVHPAAPPRLSYLVCATPRTGSSLLCEVFRRTGLAGHPEEFFQPQAARTLAGRWGCADPAGYLAELFDRTVTPNGVFGAKIMAWNVEDLLGWLRRLPGADREGPLATLSAALPNLRFVWISRRDRTAQAVSWLRALHTGHWSSLTERLPLAVPEPRLEPADIARQREQIGRFERMWRDLFEGAGVRPVRVFYEDLADDQEGTVSQILTELGIKVPADLRLGPGWLQRQSDPSGGLALA